MKRFVFDAARCNGCFNCQIACKDEHVDNDWGEIAAPQPETGHFWAKMEQRTHGQVPKVKLEYRLELCHHCENAACEKAGGDCVYTRPDGLVIIDPAKAKGHRELVEACPYGRIYYNEDLDLPQKCTGCAHLIDAGELPRCVAMCPTGALRYVDVDEDAPAFEGSTYPDAYGDCQPTVAYRNVPGLFIAGDVWDRDANEIIEGATITLSNQSGQTWVTKSDDLGDFWFHDLDAGSYTLMVEAAGYANPKPREIALQASVNVGDFPMEAK